MLSSLLLSASSAASFFAADGVRCCAPPPLLPGVRARRLRWLAAAEHDAQRYGRHSPPPPPCLCLLPSSCGRKGHAAAGCARRGVGGGADDGLGVVVGMICKCGVSIRLVFFSVEGRACCKILASTFLSWGASPPTSPLGPFGPLVLHLLRQRENQEARSAPTRGVWGAKPPTKKNTPPPTPLSGPFGSASPVLGSEYIRHARKKHHTSAPPPAHSAAHAPTRTKTATRNKRDPTIAVRDSQRRLEQQTAQGRVA